MSQKTNSEPQVALALAAMVMNYKIGPEGLVTSAHVFGEFKSVNTWSETFQRQIMLEDRSAVAQMARNEMSCITSKISINLELNTATTATSSLKMNPGDKVHIWGLGGEYYIESDR